MCGRFLFEADIEELIAYYKIVNQVQMNIHRGAVYPSQEAPVVIAPQNGMRLGTMNWGVATSVSKRLIINARSESVHQKKTFAESFFKRRCVIPVSAYYEWNSDKEGHTFSPIEDRFFSLGGIYTKDSTGTWRFVLLTKEAVGVPRSIHHRMPVLLQLESLSIWLHKDSSYNKLHQMVEQSSYQPMKISEGII